jgi:hypothetical protein
VTENVKAKGTSGFRANPADEGAVIFSIRDDKNRETHYAFAQEAVSIIISQMIAAHARAVLTNEGRLPPAIVTPTSVIATSPEEGTVTLALCPTERSMLPFALTPSHARKIAKGLTDAAASLDPATGGSDPKESEKN